MDVLGTSDLTFLEFIYEILEYDPRKRLTPRDALLHPFLASIGPFELISTSVHELMTERKDRTVTAGDIRGKLMQNASPMPTILRVKTMHERGEGLKRKTMMAPVQGEDVHGDGGGGINGDDNDDGKENRKRISLS